MMIVNAMGEDCPIPVIKAKKAIQQLSGAGTVEVLVDNEVAVQNVMKLAASMGGRTRKEQLGEAEFKVIIEIDETTNATTDGTINVTTDATTDVKGGLPMVENRTIVSISSDKMGSGNDELGKVLLKGFIFAVTQLDELPKVMLFYNGGATLTAEGSDSIEDLKNLEAQGVEILTCGTCLNYYGLTDKLQVGSVTNMYTIVEKMSAAINIIQP